MGNVKCMSGKGLLDAFIRRGLVLAVALVYIFSLSASAAVNITGNLPGGDSPPYYISIYDADAHTTGAPCTGANPTGGANKLTDLGPVSGDTSYTSADTDYNINFSVAGGEDVYVYYCDNVASSMVAFNYLGAVVDDTVYRIDLGRVSDDGVTNLHVDLNALYVQVCDGGTAVSNTGLGQQVSQGAVSHDYNVYYTFNQVTNTNTFQVWIDTDAANPCTLDDTKVAGRELYNNNEDNYRIYPVWAPNTKLGGDAHIALDNSRVDMYKTGTTSRMGSILVGNVAPPATADGLDDGDDDYKMYYDNRPAVGLDINFSSAGTTTTVTNLAAGTTSRDAVVHVAGTVSDEIDYIGYADGAGGATVSTIPASNAYDLFVPDDAGANVEVVTMRDGGSGGTLVFQASSAGPTITRDATCTPGVGGAVTAFTITAVAAAGDNDWDGTAANGECAPINVVRLYGTLDDTFQVTGTEQMNVVDDYTVITDTYNPIDLPFDPANNTLDYNTYFVLYYSNDGGVGTGTLDSAYDIFGVSAGASDYNFYLNDQLTGLTAATYDVAMNMEFKLSGDTPEGAGETVFITDGAAGTVEASATTIADGTYELYFPSLTTAADPYYQYFFVSDVLHMDAGATPLAADDTFDVAKVTGSDTNVHADLLNDFLGVPTAGNDEIRVKVGDADNTGADLYTIAGVIDPGDDGANAEAYVCYFMVPNNSIYSSSSRVNIFVYETTGAADLFYTYNKSTTGGAGYSFEPKNKVTMTAPAAIVGFEITGGDTYATYRDITSTYIIYVHEVAVDVYAYNAYTDTGFTQLVLTRGSKDVTVNTAFDVARLIGDAHADLQAGQANDNIAVFDDSACATEVSSEDIAIVAGVGANDDFIQYYETDAAGNVYLKITENDGTNNYVTCYNTEQAAPAAAGSVTQDLEIKVSGNLAQSLVTMYLDNDGAGSANPANYEVAATVVAATTPDSFKAYWGGDTDTDVMAYTTVAELVRTGFDYTVGPSFTFNVGLVGFQTHADLEAGANDNLAVYSDAACTTEVSSSADAGITEKVGAAGTVRVYFQGTDATDYYGEAEYDDGAAKYEVCRAIAFQTTNQEQASALSFDYKVAGSAPDDAGTLITNDILAVGADLAGGNTNDYWVDTEDIGATRDYNLYISDADADNQVNYWSTAGGAGTRVLSRVNVTTGTDVDMDVSVFYGEAHGSLEAANNFVQVCDTAITAAAQAGVCPGKRSSNDSTSGITPANNGFGAAADYAVYFVDEGAGDTAYFLEVNDTDTSNYYSYVSGSCTGPGVECNVELDGKLSADVVEDYNTAIGINGVRCLIGDNNIANELSFTYSIGGGLATVAKCIAYADAAAAYDYRFAMQTYITQDYLTNGDAGADPDMNNEVLDLTLTGAAGNTMEVELATGIQIHVTTSETSDPTNLTKATVYILNCTTADQCNADTPLANVCTIAGVNNQACVITGDNTAGKGANGLYYFAGIPDSTRVKVKVVQTGYVTYEYPGPSNEPGTNFYTTSSTVPIDLLITMPQVMPDCDLSVIGGPGTFSSGGMLYLKSGQAVTLYYDCNASNLTVTYDANGPSGTNGINESGTNTDPLADNGIGIYTATVLTGFSASGTKIVTVTAMDGAATIATDTVFVVGDNDAPAFTKTLPGATTNTRSVILAGTTGENAECRYAATDVAFASMTNVMAGSGTLHQAMVYAANGANTYYVQCQDSVGNSPGATFGTTVTFTVDAVAPSVYQVNPVYNATPYNATTLAATVLGDIGFATDMSGTCMWDYADRAYDQMTEGPIASTATVWNSLGVTPQEGLNTLFIRCQSAGGIKADSSAMIIFNYDNIAPTYALVSANTSGISNEYLNASDSITVVVEASEDLASAPTITLGGEAADTACVKTGRVIVCGWDATSFGTDGAKALSVTGGADAAGNAGTTLTVAGLVTIDTAAPFLSGALPSTTQNTRSFTVSVNATGAVYCAFDTNDVAYSQMQYYATDLGTGVFQGTIVVPSDGYYSVHFACIDVAGNINTTRTATFMVNATAPTITASSPQGGYMNTTVTLNVTTDVDANCKYDTQDRSFATMAYGFETGNGTTEHTTNVTPASQGLVHYYVACNNTNGSVMGSSVLTYFTYDTVAPTIYLSWANYYRSLDEVRVAVLTDEPLGQLMMTFDGDDMALESGNGTVFIFSIDVSSGYPDDSYDVNFSACSDLAGNDCVDPTGYFPYEVDIDTAAPVIGSGDMSYNASTWIVSADTNEDAVCKYSIGADTANYSAMENAMTGSGTHHTAMIHPQEGTNTINFRCEDYYGNVMTASSSISFSVDTVAPFITGSGPLLSNSSSVTLWAYTNENASCEYATTPFSYGSGTAMAGAALNHTVALAGLADGMHNYYVKCRDASSNVMASSQPIGFLVDTVGNFNYTLNLNVGWNYLVLPRVVLANFSSLAGNYTVAHVLEAHGGLVANVTYNFLYGRNVTSGAWASYVPGRPANDLLEFNADYDGVPYWIHVLASDRLEINRLETP